MTEDREAWAEFDEKGYCFIASIGDEAWLLEVVHPDGVVDEYSIPMQHPPYFGPDLADLERLEAETERLMAQMGIL